jgi:integrase
MTSQALDLHIEMWPIDRLVPYTRNPRRNDDAVNRMASSLREYGFKIPVLACSSGGVVDGHLRLKAAKKLGIAEVPVILRDEWTEPQVRAFSQLARFTTSAKSSRRSGRQNLKGLPDRTILAVLLGCGLRGSEAAALTLAHLRQLDGRWCVVDLLGKHGRVRTVPMPSWVKLAIDAWMSAAGVADDHVFRPVNRADRMRGERLGEKAIWLMLPQYAQAVGIPCIAPHDAR